MNRFFRDNALAANVINRFINEYSHSSKIFEKIILPVDVSGMKKTAKFILDKVKNTDPDQYSALLQSIGAEDALKIDDEP